MDQVNNFISALRDIECRICQKITCRSLYSRLKNGTTDERVPCPLAGVGILAVDGDAELLAPPWSGEQLELWPLPADKPA